MDNIYGECFIRGILQHPVMSKEQNHWIAYAPEVKMSVWGKNVTLVAKTLYSLEYYWVNDIGWLPENKSTIISYITHVYPATFLLVYLLTEYTNSNLQKGQIHEKGNAPEIWYQQTYFACVSSQTLFCE